MLPSKMTVHLLYLFKISNDERLKMQFTQTIAKNITKNKRVKRISFLSVSIFSSFCAKRAHRYHSPEDGPSSLTMTMGRKYAFKLLYTSWFIYFFSKKMNAFTKRIHKFREGPRTLSGSHSRSDFSSDQRGA